MRDSCTTTTKGENVYWCSRRQHNALETGVYILLLLLYLIFLNTCFSLGQSKRILLKNITKSYQHQTFKQWCKYLLTFDSISPYRTFVSLLDISTIHLHKEFIVLYKGKRSITLNAACNAEYNTTNCEEFNMQYKISLSTVMH